jgi:hypothetical protein
MAGAAGDGYRLARQSFDRAKIAAFFMRAE